MRILFIFLTILNLTFAFEWQITQIAEGYGLERGFITLDSYSHPHIAWRNCRRHPLPLFWAYLIRDSWYIINPPCSSGEWPNYPALLNLRLGSDNYPHLIYIRDTFFYHMWLSDTLCAGAANENGWTYERVDTASYYTTEYTGFALGRYNTLHFVHSYHKSPWLKVVYLKKEGASWEREVIDSVDERYIIYETRLISDRFDRPHISYQIDSVVPVGERYAKIKYAHFDGNSWHYEWVDTLGPACLSLYRGAAHDFTLDRQDNPHFVIEGGCGSINDTTMYVYKTDTIWKFKYFVCDEFNKSLRIKTDAREREMVHILLYVFGQPHMMYYLIWDGEFKVDTIPFEDRDAMWDFVLNSLNLPHLAAYSFHPQPSIIWYIRGYEGGAIGEGFSSSQKRISTFKLPKEKEGSLYDAKGSLVSQDFWEKKTFPRCLFVNFRGRQKKAKIYKNSLNY